MTTGLRKLYEIPLTDINTILDMPSCQMVLDPQYSRVNSNNRVTLLDLTSNYYFLSNTNEIQLNRFRGNRSILFNRQVNRLLTNQLSSPRIDFGLDFTLYIVGNFLSDTNNTWAWIFSAFNATGNRNPSFVIAYLENRLRVHYGNWFTEVGWAVNNGVGQDTVIRVSRESNIIKIWERFSRVNSDTSVGTTSIGNTQNIHIGGLADDVNTGLGGSLALVLGFNGILSNTETTTIENYIKNRFGF